MFSLNNRKHRRLTNSTVFSALPASKRGKFCFFSCSKPLVRRRRRIRRVSCLVFAGRPLPAFGGRKGGRFAMGALFSSLIGNGKACLRSCSARSDERLEGSEFEEYESGVVGLRDRYPENKDQLFCSTVPGYEVIDVEDDDNEDELCGYPKDGFDGKMSNQNPRFSREEIQKRLAQSKKSQFRSSQEVLPGPPFTFEDEQEIYYALRGGNNKEVLVTHQASNILITRKTLQSLNQNAWLNDEVINLYLELLKEREKREPDRFLKCHFFNTFFYTKLTGGRTGYDYKAVRRWTATKKLGYCLIECDKIFVPIHKGFHWCLAVIDIREQTFQYLDSLGGSDKSALKTLARYFSDEVEDKNNKVTDATSWKTKPVDNLPLQKNGWDCGMFMLKYCDFYSRGLDLCFSQEHMKYFRKRTIMEIIRLRAE